MDVEALPTIGMEDPYFYRNKIQVPFGCDSKGNVYCGFYKQNTTSSFLSKSAISRTNGPNLS